MFCLSFQYFGHQKAVEQPGCLSHFGSGAGQPRDADEVGSDARRFHVRPKKTKKKRFLGGANSQSA